MGLTCRLWSISITMARLRGNRMRSDSLEFGDPKLWKWHCLTGNISNIMKRARDNIVSIFYEAFNPFIWCNCPKLMLPLMRQKMWLQCWLFWSCILWKSVIIIIITIWQPMPHFSFVLRPFIRISALLTNPTRAESRLISSSRLPHRTEIASTQKSWRAMLLTRHWRITMTGTELSYRRCSHEGQWPLKKARRSSQRFSQHKMVYMWPSILLLPSLLYY